jgi:hypothetical protein
MSSAGRLLVVVLLLCHFGLEEVDALTTGSRPSPRYAMGFAATPDGMLYVFGGVGSSLSGNVRGDGVGWMWPVAWDVVIRRARVAPLLSLSRSLAEGTRVEREETCTYVCTYAVAQWAVYVRLREELAIRWFALGREIGQRLS